MARWPGVLQDISPPRFIADELDPADNRALARGSEITSEVAHVDSGRALTGARVRKWEPITEVRLNPEATTIRQENHTAA